MMETPIGNEPVSALVILRGSIAGLRGSSRDREGLLEAVRRVYGRLERLGFEAGTVTEVGFAVSGPKAVFEAIFGVTVVQTPEGGHIFRENGEAPREFRSLVGERIPEELRDDVEAIALSPLPQLGPIWKQGH